MRPKRESEYPKAPIQIRKIYTEERRLRVLDLVHQAADQLKGIDSELHRIRIPIFQDLTIGKPVGRMATIPFPVECFVGCWWRCDRTDEENKIARLDEIHRAMKEAVGKYQS